MPVYFMVDRYVHNFEMFKFKTTLIARNTSRNSLVAQWVRIRLPMQGTWVQSWVQKDSTYRGATEPMHPNY